MITLANLMLLLAAKQLIRAPEKRPRIVRGASARTFGRRDGLPSVRLTLARHPVLE
jgi:hypothetical protein